MNTDATIHIASEADLDALVRLAVAFRDHVGQSVLLQEVPVICYKQPDGSNPRSSETGHE